MKRTLLVFCVLFSLTAVSRADSLKMVLNEWNAVSSSKTLKGGGSDIVFGIVPGNGDNWVELAVVEDHLDIRGWTIQWADNNGTPDSGTISFTDSPVWSDIRKGTIIGLREHDEETQTYGPLPSDTSYDPFVGDWTIFADIDDATLIVDNLEHHWKVDNDNWKACIKDATGDLVQDYVGENGSGAHYMTTGGIGSNEVGSLDSGPRVDLGLTYKVKSSSTFLSPNNLGQEQDFAAMRSEVTAPEPATIVLLLIALAGCVVRRICGRRA
jgi:hypothetical protein